MVAPDSKYHHYMLKCVKIRGAPFYTSMHAQEPGQKKGYEKICCHSGVFSVCLMLLWCAYCHNLGQFKKKSSKFCRSLSFFVGENACVVVGIEA